MSSVEAGRIGLIETIRARDGRLPLLGRHLERLQTSVTDLGLTPPSTDLDELIRTSVVSDDLVVRLELRDGSAEITTRDASNGRSLSIMVAAEIHHPY
jgi:branched-subunit amino acid aminotransferase/4-amino-4-deoxychorismate lyase